MVLGSALDLSVGGQAPREAGGAVQAGSPSPRGASLIWGFLSFVN